MTRVIVCISIGNGTVEHIKWVRRWWIQAAKQFVIRNMVGPNGNTTIAVCFDCFLAKRTAVVPVLLRLKVYLNESASRISSCQHRIVNIT